MSQHASLNDLLQKRGEWKEGSRGLGLKKTKPEA